MIATETRIDHDPLTAELRTGPPDDLFFTDGMRRTAGHAGAEEFECPQVSGPQIPSGARPISFWKELSPAWVRGPKYPSTRST